MYKIIIWDWNGTLLDDVDISVKSINKVLSKYKCNPLKDIDEYRNKFCFPVELYYRNIGFDFNKTPFEVLGKEFIDIYKDISKECKLQNNALKVIKEINKRGLKQIILSASQIDNLIEQINYYSISKYFDKILGIENIYAKAKLDIAQRWIEDNKINPREALMIGDTFHDFEVSHKINCDCILFLNGHQNKQTLLKTNCEIIDDLWYILNYI